MQQFGYDRYGNRTSFSQTLGGVTTNTTPSVDAATNRFSAGQGFSYDASGNAVQDTDPMTGNVRSFAFDGENKQREVKDVTNSNHVVGTYFYDGDGRRVKKVTDTETTIFVYDAGGKLVALYSNATPPATPQVSYTTTDHLGSPRILTDQYGAVISRRDFLPFGEEINPGIGSRSSALNYGTNDNIRQKFTGYERDPETSLDFAQARMYANRLGRFTSTDPLYFQIAMIADPQRFNLFVYAKNNPLKFTDPDGETVMVAEGSSLDEIYKMVGGQKIFDHFFEIQDGLIVTRSGVDISNANQGVQFLNELIGRPEIFLVYLGADANAVARLFEGTTNSEGNLNSKGQKIAKEFQNNGSIVSTNGRRGQANQPGGAAFMVIAINAETLHLTQTGVNSFNFGRGFTEFQEQLSGVGQKVQAVSLLIHELAENLDFARNGTHSQFSPPLERGSSEFQRQQYYGYRHYRRAHGYAIKREAMIRRDLKLAGGFAGGSLNGTTLLDWRRP